MKIYPAHEQSYIYVINDEDLVIQVNSDYSNSFHGSFSHTMVGQSIWDFIEQSEIKSVYKKIFQFVRSSKKTLHIPFYCNSSMKKTYLKLVISSLKYDYIQIKSEMVCFEYHDKINERDLKYSSLTDSNCICSVSHAIKHENVYLDNDKEYASLIKMANKYEVPEVFHGLYKYKSNSLIDVENNKAVSYLT